MPSVGKISGKFCEGGTNWTLTAASYTGYDPDATNYTATVTAKYSWKAKSGKKTVSKSFTRTFALAVSPDPEFPVRVSSYARFADAHQIPAIPKMLPTAENECGIMFAQN